MKITILQTDIRWADPAWNVIRADEIVRRHGGTDLFVLPEMFTTGFCTRPQGIAEPDGGKGLEWMRRTADERGCAIAGSIAVEEKGRYYNRFFFVKPGGQTEWYDKRHLFTYGGEHHTYTPGSQRTVVEWRGMRFLLQVCYDLRFAIGAITMSLSMWRVGLLRVWRRGRLCFVRVLSKTSAMWWLSTGWVKTRPVSTAEGVPLSTLTERRLRHAKTDVRVRQKLSST